MTDNTVGLNGQTLLGEVLKFQLLRRENTFSEELSEVKNVSIVTLHE
jgi:hypothetical protein